MKTLIIYACFTFGCIAAFGSELKKAEAALQAGDFAAAKALLEPETPGESDARALFLMGRAELGLGNPEAAEKALSKAIKLDAKQADYFSQRAMARVSRAQSMSPFAAGPIYMESLEDHRTAIALDPDHLASHIGLARYYSNAPEIAGGSMEKAKRHAAEVSRLHPYLGHVEKALIAEREGRLAEAIESYEAALALDDGEAQLRFEIGRLLQKAGRTQEAETAYRAVLERDPQHEGAQAALAAL